MGMTLKLGSSHLSGTAHPKKARQVCSNINSMSTSLKTLTEWSIINFLQKDKLETNVTKLTPHGICSKMCSANNKRSAIQGIGFSTMITNLLSPI
jgi:hypothetical protein